MKKWVPLKKDINTIFHDINKSRLCVIILNNGLNIGFL